MVTMLQLEANGRECVQEEVLPDVAACLLEYAATISEHCAHCPDRDERLALLAVRKRMEKLAARLVAG